MVVVVVVVLCSSGGAIAYWTSCKDCDMLVRLEIAGGLMDSAKVNGNAKLDADLVRHIRRVLRDKETTVREVAEVHQLAVETVRRIVRRETWGWVTDALPLPPVAVLKEEAAASLQRVMQMAGKGEEFQQMQSAAERMATEAARLKRLGSEQLLNELKGDEDGS